LLGLPNEFGELIQFDPKVYVVTSREGKHREFKQAFVENDFADYTKTLAAFGNAAGGCIVFGISDKPRKIVGIGNITDEAQWADRLKDEFDPEIVIASRVYVVDEMTILVIGVDIARSFARRTAPNASPTAMASRKTSKSCARAQFIIGMPRRLEPFGIQS
jgi:predicted HTH transcriptional regulator